MSRPQGLETDAFVDALVQAHAGAPVERRFQVSQLPRLSEAGIDEPGDIRLSVRFSIVEGHVALDGRVRGSVTMTCQRCMQPAKVEIDDEFQLTIINDDAATSQQEEESVGYEPIVADPARLDVRWLAEEQTLLAAPLVAKHADEGCAGAVAVESKETVGQKPFANLKDMLRGK